MNRIVNSILDYVKTPVARQLNQTQAEIEEELNFHLRSRTDEYHAHGMSVSDSSTAAVDRFGDINRIASECRKESSTLPIWTHRVHLALTAGLMIVATLLMFDVVRSRNVLARQEIREGDLGGVVLDEHGRPLIDAHVMVAIKWWPDNGFRQQCYMTRTDARGSFSIDDVYPAGTKHELQVAAIADGHLLTSQYITDQARSLNALSLRLARSTARLTLQFQSTDGEPIAGVATFPHRRVEAAGDDHMVYFQSADRIVKQSDQSGKIELSHFQSGDLATVFVRFPKDDDWQTREIVVPESESVVVITPGEPPTVGG